MSLITCPGCKCIVDDSFGHCTICNHKFVNQYDEANKKWLEQIENEKKFYEELNRQRDEYYYNDSVNSSSKSYSSNTYNSSSSRYNKKSGKKGNHSTMSYIILGIICGLIINSLALGLTEFFILYIIAVIIFLN